jgi:hypothetical protein
MERDFVLPGMSEVESNAALTQKALGWIKTHPRQFLSLLPLKAGRHWSPIAFHVAGEYPLPRGLRIAAITLFLVLYMLVILGCGTLVRQGKPWTAATLLVAPLGLLIPSLIGSGATRFALPSFPQLAVLASVGIAQLEQSAGKSSP